MAVQHEQNPRRRPRIITRLTKRGAPGNWALDEAITEAITLRVDSIRGSSGASGDLDAGAAALLAAAVDEHVLAQRRYVRLDFSGVTSVDDAAIEVLAELHDRVLAQRGTLILIRVDARLEVMLTRADRAFLMIAPSAMTGIPARAPAGARLD